MPYVVHPVLRLSPSTRRSIVFLSDGSDELGAFDVFQELDKPGSNGQIGRAGKDVRSRFGLWISEGRHDLWFHGWPNHPEYKDCFCFKWKVKSVGHRFYGFLCHPMPQTNPSFLVCALHSHDTKNEQETEKRNLKLAKKLQGDSYVMGALQRHFLPDQLRVNKWKN